MLVIVRYMSRLKRVRLVVARRHRRCSGAHRRAQHHARHSGRQTSSRWRLRSAAVTDSLFERTFELFTGTHIYPGQHREQALNGDGTYPRLWADLRSAQHTITVQMYYSLPGKVADTMAAILEERARAHSARAVSARRVRLAASLEGRGSTRCATPASRWRKLRKLRWYTIHNASDRSHVRVVVVDGRIGYTGGFGLADYWLGDGHHDDQWRESNVRFEGPAVMQLQAAFAAAWAEATGELLTGPLFFPTSGFQPVGPTHAGCCYTAPTTGSTPAERFLALTISGARKTLYITNSYFVPDDDFRGCSSAPRGAAWTCAC